MPNQTVALSDLSEAELVQKAQIGDDAAFTECDGAANISIGQARKYNFTLVNNFSGRSSGGRPARHRGLQHLWIVVIREYWHTVLDHPCRNGTAHRTNADKPYAFHFLRLKNACPSWYASIR